MSETGLARLRYIEGLCAGIFLFALGTTGAALYALPTDRGILDLSTLISATIAIAAACFTVRGITAQIKNTNEVEHKRRKRAERSAKARLALALSELSNHCDSAIDWYSAPKKVENRSVVSKGTIDAVVGMIEHCDASTATHLSALITQFQVTESRTELHQRRFQVLEPYHQVNFSGDGMHYDTLFRWCLVKIGCSSAFKYARGISATIGAIEITRDHVESTYTDAIINKGLFKSYKFEGEARLKERLELWFQQGSIKFSGFMN